MYGVRGVHRAWGDPEALVQGPLPGGQHHVVSWIHAKKAKLESVEEAESEVELAEAAEDAAPEPPSAATAFCASARRARAAAAQHRTWAARLKRSRRRRIH